MNGFNKHVFAIAALGALLAGCQPNDPPLTTPPPQPQAAIDYKVAQQTANGLTVSIDTRVDILFVIDDSRSMQAHADNLSRNIQQFVDGFAKNKAIDFHIAYTTVHDRLRYGPIVPPVCGQDTNAPGRVNWEQPGTLKTLSGPYAPKDRRYLTRDDKNFRDVLKTSLSPKENPTLIKDFVGGDLNSKICPEGAENEESFTPALAALEDPTLSSGPNKGFRRPGALFVVIIVSDAKDESVNYGLTPATFISRLAQDTGETQGGKKRFRVFSVAISPGTKIGNDPSTGACLPDPAFADGSTVTRDGRTHYEWPRSRLVKEGENPLVEAARLTEDQSSVKEGQVLSICASNYGTTLAKYGFQIQQDALSDVTIDLPRRPQLTMDATKKLRVFLGETELEEGSQWNYNPEDVTVIVYGQKIDWQSYPNQKIRVSYTPADDTQKTTRSAFN